ncbi:MAG TPA: MBL fold metallo-hydrolase [Thermomicrobiales bacterium]|nr:MBL fold metallo-hydrolase [Thermomicrobiales bacterium]
MQPSTPSCVPRPRAISVQSLGSGSSGNAFLITTGTDTLLIDCGVGIRTLTASLRKRNIAINEISAICITHEHSDHIRTLPKVMHEGATFYSTRGTASRSALPMERHQRAIEDVPVWIAGVAIWSLPVAHDAMEPCGFMAELPDGSRVTMLTDLGSWQESLREFVRASDLIILEANHDEEMLRLGPYPTYLKRRVASNTGHLSNRHCGLALGEALRGSTHHPQIWLAHLSEHNNRPDLAEETVRSLLAERELDLAVTALPRRSPSEIWTPGERSGTPQTFNRMRPQKVEQLGFDLF